MFTDKNIIRKQTVNFRYNGNTDAFVLQKEVSDWCKFSLIPEIEQQLELVDLGDNYITIDKLVIDANIDRKDWQQKIRNELITSLNQKLRDHKTHGIKKANNQKDKDRSRKLDELVLFYFEKGYLPWWSRAFAEKDFDTLLLTWIKEEKSQARADAIVFKLQQIISATVIQRILNLVPGSLFFMFMQHIFKKEADAIVEAGSFFKEVLKGNIARAKEKAMAAGFYEVMLLMLLKDSGKINIESSVQGFRAIIKNGTVFTAGELKKMPGKINLSTNRFAKAWQTILKEEIKDISGKHSEEIKKENKYKYHRTTDQLTNKTIAENLKKGIAEDLREGIYIENAGAVIIAPFLPRLFERLKITDKTTIIKPDQGALVIQYIVSGNAKAEEHELVLPKILCGIGPQLPVNTSRKITKAQQAEADEMLSAVIEHWAVIKNTSIDGLRESFLKRSGKLIQADEEWLLQAEQKSYDMLLQQLPWNISMIKLPWMERVLKTEWV
ncbi:MAG: hypothetical protein JNM14_02710 [Ferruginibacter sp.]|nr:hypothetical protein [Ferruginibacter sp.]